MTQRRKQKETLFLIAMGAAILLASCRPSAKPQTEETLDAPSGEPETYAAIIVRSIEDGERREEIVSRIVVAPDKRREEWIENGERRISILRFDTGKSYLLDVAHHLYSETDLNQNAPTEKKTEGTKEATGVENDNTMNHPKPPEWMLEDFREEPTNVETATLVDEIISGEHCKVTERRAHFADNRLEITKIFRAERLGELMMKIEEESIAPNHRVRITIERRDLDFNISADEFTIPMDFKKAQKLSS